jgi:hypothetical protein
MCGTCAPQVDAALESDLADLQLALALGPKEAAGVREEVVSATYRCPAHRPAAACCPDGLPSWASLI